MTNFYRLLLLTIINTVFIISQSYSQGYKEISFVEHDQDNALFGQSVAIDGNTAVVRCQLCPSGGAAFVYEFDGTDWNRVATLTPSFPENNESFSRSVDIKDDVIVIGNRISRAYVYEKPTSGWTDMTETAILTTNVSTVGPNTVGGFGELVKITNKYILAYEDFRGRVFVYEKPTNGWIDMNETTYIDYDGIGDRFGRGIDALGDTILVAASVGATAETAFLFIKPPNGWPEIVEVADVNLQSFTPANADGLNRFAHINENHIYIGIQENPVHIYERPVGGWGSITTATEDHLLSAQQGSTVSFNFSMDVAGDSVVVVSDRDVGPGEVQIFYKDNTGGWSSKTPDQLITSSNGVANDRFGQFVALGDDFKLLVGAHQIDRNGLTNSGGFYYFENCEFATGNAIDNAVMIGAFGELLGFNANGVPEIRNNSIPGSPFELVEGSDKLLYGTTFRGGASDLGYIYRIYPDGRNFEIIHEFDGVGVGQTGASPSGPMVASGGKLYGTTKGDRNSLPGLSSGSLFSINEDGSDFTTIDAPSTSGSGYVSVFEASNGVLYVCHRQNEEIFRINKNGTNKVIIAGGSTMIASGGFIGDLAEYDGKLYGISISGIGSGTSADGGIFSIDLTTDEFTVEYSLSNEFGDSDGVESDNGVVLKDGIMFGNTRSGGANNRGTLFSYDIENNAYSVLYDYSESNKTALSLLGDRFIYGFTPFDNNVGSLIQLNPDCGTVLETRPFTASIASPSSKPVDIENDPPTVLSPIPDFSLEEDFTNGFVSGAQNLSLNFGASDEPAQNLDLVLGQISNSSLFESINIIDANDITDAELIFTLADDAFGVSDLTITARDARGGSTSLTFTVDVAALADDPSITAASTAYGAQNSSGLVVSRNAVDGNEVTHFKVTNIQNGSLFLNDGMTEVSEGDFVTFAEGGLGLKWSPSAAVNGSFDIQASTSDQDTDLAGAVVPATITVDKADLTSTADDISREYGEPNPTLTVSYSGFVDEEDESVLTAQLIVSTMADITSNVGDYTINVSGAASDNYAITEVAGNLTITETQLLVGAFNKIITFGDPIPTLDGTIIGIKNNDNITATYETAANSS
ncbi:MAG: choice-of-anchor tandem repeat GloVer-containing protein, partial [Bacteroidota bacterium]